MDHLLKNQPSNAIDRLFPDIREMTSARIGTGRTGGSLTTSQILDFDQAHARARDAVWADFDPETLARQLNQDDLEQNFNSEISILKSAATDRATYIKRPDLGRRLDNASAEKLLKIQKKPDLILILSDGLSSLALTNQSPAIIQCLKRQFAKDNLQIGPVLIIPRARVGIVDHIGDLTEARSVAILLGERPGLSAPESLGIYYTYKPRSGCTDADRNCISNIHSLGLSPEIAAAMLHQIFLQSFLLEKSGVFLSEKMSETVSIDRS